MKIYVGIAMPLAEGQKEHVCKVMVTDGGETREIVPVQSGMKFGWGQRSIWVGNVALAILVDYMGEPDGRPLYMRLAHRVASGWKAGEAWRLTGEEIDRTIADIRGNQNDVNMARKLAGEAVPPRVSDTVPERADDPNSKIIAPIGGASSPHGNIG